MSTHIGHYYTGPWKLCGAAACGLPLAAGGTVCPFALGQSNRTRLHSAFLRIAIEPIHDETISSEFRSKVMYIQKYYPISIPFPIKY